MKRILNLWLLLFVLVAAGYSQVDNYCLRLTNGASVDGGVLYELSEANSYALQWWMSADEWNEGAFILGDNEGLNVTIAQAQTLKFRLGKSTVTVTNANLQPNQWIQLTLLVDQGTMRLLINGKEAHKAEGNYQLPTATGNFHLGGTGFAGRLDEVRVWSACLANQYDYFVNNTLNKWVPQLDHLVLYYKCDQNLCPDALVDYRALFAGAAHNHHATLTSGALRELVTDNTGLPYLMCGAYTNNQRFFDRAIGRDQYLLANDLIILGIQSYADGHLKYLSPNCHATSVDGSYLASFEGRQGVLALNGGKGMVTNEDLFTPEIDTNGKASKGYTFETWIYLDEWTEGAYLFKKLGSDGRGFAISLGADSTKQVVVTVDGERYVNIKSMEVGRWIHFAVTVNAGDATRTTLLFSYDGKDKWANANASSGSTNYTPTGMEGVTAVIGEGLKGKLDETMVWNTKHSLDVIKGHMTRIPFPGIGHSETASVILSGSGYYTYDNPDQLGWDSYSQDEWKNIMLSAYEGHRGYQVRISVIGHTNWQNTISNANKRKIFAEDLAKLSAGYDGVELDLEWMDGTQTNLGLLTEEIRKALPADKTVMVSCHAYGAYQFPKAKMDQADGFTFQQYGPQKRWSAYSNFESSYNSFVNYGFTKDKIYLSYATTTSKGHDSSDNAAVPISGWRNVIAAGGYTPSDNLGFRSANFGGYNYYYQSPEQVYARAKFVADKGLKGIFYWDMGNDIPVENPYNLARACNYALSANVDTLITEVTIQHPTAAIKTVRTQNAALQQAQDWLYAKSDAKVCGIDLYSPKGVMLATVKEDRLWIGTMTQGLYIAKVYLANGNSVTQTFVKE